jgi:hypothetical protein
MYSLIDHTYVAAAEILDDTTAQNGLADHCGESYVGETGKQWSFGGTSPSNSPVKGTGYPINGAVFYCTPWRYSGCPACEPNFFNCS